MLTVVAAAQNTVPVTVEITLTEMLDEPRGLCIDIVGWQTRANPAQGLQAHTCYSYQGTIAADQGFDASRLARGEFRLPAFDVCMTHRDHHPGAQLTLAACDESTPQMFELRPDGRIATRQASALCLTVSDSPSRPGGGGQPPHLIRPLILEPCADERLRFQRWQLRPGLAR